MRGLWHVGASLSLVTSSCGAAESPQPQPPPEEQRIEAGPEAPVPLRPIGAAPALELEGDVQHTALSVDLTTLRAIADISMLTDADGRGRVSVAGLDVDKVSVDRGTVEGDAGVLTLRADPRTVVRLHVEYAFRVHDRLEGLQRDGATFLWPNLCAELYPCDPFPIDGGTTSLQISGQPAGEVVVYAPRVEFQAPPYMLAWATGAYSQRSLGRTSVGTEVLEWRLRGSKTVAGTQTLVAAFNWLEQTMGPYAFGSQVGSVEVQWPDGTYGGMEHHPYWHVSADDFGSSVTHVHEAVHGWFGDAVRIQCWEDLALSEGIATYLEARIAGVLGGKKAAARAWEQLRDSLEDIDGPGSPPAWPEGCGKVDPASMYTQRPYVLGAWFLRDVAVAHGDDKVDLALADLYTRFRGRAARVSDLVHALEAQTKSDLKLCAEAWLRADPPEPGHCRVPASTP